MKKKERYNIFIEYFKKKLPNPKTELNYKTPFELLLAVVLSAQCTDKRVNQVTPALFKRFKTPEDFLGVEVQEVFYYIQSISYPNSKAKYLIGLSKKLLDNFCGQIPKDPEQLQTLPGVGRKTANVVCSILFDLPLMPVDTHVFRVSARLGLVTKSKTPLETELQLTKNLPDKYIKMAHHWLILHGRYVCLAKKPKCFECGLTNICVLYKKLNIKN